MSKLNKPHFIKVKDLLNSRSGYNVYVKVVKAEESKSNDGLTTFVRAVVADESASVNTFFKGETAKLIKEGAVIAIRNGTVKFIKNKICLQIDIFGRVTSEKVQIKVNDAENISDKEIERKRERRPREDRPREDRPRRPRHHDEDRPPRRNRDNQDRPPRRDREDRPPRRENEDRPPRRDREDRPPRRDYEDRPPRRNRQDDERPPRRDFQDRDRQERRPPISWTKISAIEPGDENLNIFAQVVSAEKLKNKVRLVLGDETGTVKAFMFQDDVLEEGNTVVLFKASAPVNKQHIEVQLPRGGKVQRARREIREVNHKYDISAKEWVEAS